MPRGLQLPRPTTRKRHVVGRKRRHKHAASPCLRDNLITRASMLISALLYAHLGALRQQSLSSCARALWHRIGPWCGLWGAQDGKKHAARPCLRDNLITLASMVIFTLLNMQLGAIRERQQQCESTLAQMSTHIRGGRPNTAQIAKNESQRTSPSVWPSSPLGALVHAAPHGLAAALRFAITCLACPFCQVRDSP